MTGMMTMKTLPAAIEMFKGKRVTVVGLAREGSALARFLSGHGALVTVSDSKSMLDLQGPLRSLQGLDLKLSLGTNRIEDTVEADLVYVSPGVPPNLPSLQAARRAGVPISSATRLFFQLCPGRIAAVSGSCGKSTTTTLLGRMLEAGGMRTFVGGNLGIPLLERLPEMDAQTWAVLELSSFQMELMEESPSVAILTNLRPDHLDRHASLEEYAEAKSRLIRYQSPSDFAVLNYDDPGIRDMAGLTRSRVLFFSLESELPEGAFLRGDDLIVSLNGRQTSVCSASEVRLVGRHNLYNVLSASLAAMLCGTTPRAAGDAARSFPGLRHRLELVRQVKGVSYYNDSIATTPDRAVAAINSFQRPVILISGGRDKHLPLEPLAQAIAARCKAVALYGEGGELLQKLLVEAGSGGAGPAVSRAHAFQDAVEKAISFATAGDVVLMAPGFTSFDQFSSYEERGESFRQLVERLG